MNETGRVTRAANENPWYVLMTLYGEQNAKYPDKAIAIKNRKVWNAWACQEISYEEFEKSARLSTLIQGSQKSWPELRSEVTQLHEDEMRRRNDSNFKYPGLPNCDSTYDLTWLAVTSRKVVWLFPEQLWLKFVPVFHRLQGCFAAQG